MCYVKFVVNLYIAATWHYQLSSTQAWLVPTGITLSYLPPATLKGRPHKGTFTSTIFNSSHPLYTKCFSFHWPLKDGSLSVTQEFCVEELN